MKKLLFAILLILTMSIPVFAAITPPYFGIFAVSQGLTYIPLNGSIEGATDFEYGTGMELMLGDEFFFYALSRLYRAVDNKLTDGGPMFINGLGVGYRALDLRENNRGHLLTTSITFSFSSSSSYKSDSYEERVSLSGYGVEFFATYYYNVFKNFALRAGANFGVFSATQKNEYGIIYMTKLTEISKGVMINYGLSIGLAF